MSQTQNRTSLEAYFEPFRKGILGADMRIRTPEGDKPLVYADWTASGRMYTPIEERLLREVYPLVANTHTETTQTGSAMTKAYQKARALIKAHVNAGPEDILITTDSGMTGVVNKFQRILGLKVSEHLRDLISLPEEQRPIVFISHMEHHSNHTSWLETLADVVVVPGDEMGLISLKNFERAIEEYPNRETKIVSVTAGSNVTGIRSDYHAIARLIHRFGGFCFVDFACTAPYVTIDMHPDEESSLDAVFFSPHKFLGGPGSPGVLLFNSKLYKNVIPDNPGGGTVTYTNPWGDRDYVPNIEEREDGGTPAFLQTIRAAMAIRLKEEMGVQNILDREHEINAMMFSRLRQIKNLRLLADGHTDRLGIFSFYVENAHYNLIVRLLNDKYGIQTRGGCSCAGTYGHYLLNVDESTSKAIEAQILQGCLLDRPGWIRCSIHPTMSTAEIHYICDAIEAVATNFEVWGKSYTYHSEHNEFTHRDFPATASDLVEAWFDGIQ